MGDDYTKPNYIQIDIFNNNAPLLIFMKVYIAGKFEDKETILNLHKKIKKLGHTLSYDWTTHKNIKPYLKNKETARQYAENELKGIVDCDVFIYLSHERGTTLPMEFGAALSLLKKTGKPLVYAVGEFNDRSP